MYNVNRFKNADPIAPDDAKEGGREREKDTERNPVLDLNSRRKTRNERGARKRDDAEIKGGAWEGFVSWSDNYHAKGARPFQKLMFISITVVSARASTRPIAEMKKTEKKKNKITLRKGRNDDEERQNADVASFRYRTERT